MQTAHPYVMFTPKTDCETCYSQVFNHHLLMSPSLGKSVLTTLLYRTQCKYHYTPSNHPIVLGLRATNYSILSRLLVEYRLFLSCRPRKTCRWMSISLIRRSSQNTFNLFNVNFPNLEILKNTMNSFEGSWTNFGPDLKHFGFYSIWTGIIRTV